MSNNAPLVILTDRVSEMKCTLCGCLIDVSELEPFTEIECPDCGHIESVPAHFGPFLLLNLIGSGGMGAVYRAQDPVLGRFVAIKVMLQSLGADEKFVADFKREAQAIARLNHPNIVQIYSFGQEKGQPYIVMEFVGGGRLDKMIEGGKSISQLLAMQIGRDISEGLAAAEEAGLLHGDIKPENILFDDRMKAKLVDFGLAGLVKRQDTEGLWGTPYYVSPEKVLRKKVDIRADIYGLGATLYHALAGRPPFEGNTPVEVIKVRLHNDPIPLHDVVSNIHPTVSRIISRMLAREPARRYPTYLSLISDFKKAIDDLNKGIKAVTVLTPEHSTKKHLVYRKTAEEPAPPPEPVSVTGHATRVIIKKKPSIMQNVITHHTIESNKESPVQKRPPRKKFSKVGVLVIGMLLLGSASGGTYIYIKHKQKQTIEARREAFALQKEQQNGEQIFADIQRVSNNISRISTTVEEYCVAASNAVIAVLGESLDKPIPQLVPSPVPVTNVTPKVETTPPAGATTTKASETTSEKKDNDEDVPSFLISKKELDRRRLGITETPPAKPEPSPQPQPTLTNAPPLSDVAVVPVPPPEPEPEIKVLARSVISEASNTLQKVQEANNIASIAGNVYNKLISCDNSSVASVITRGLENIQNKIKQIEGEIIKTADNTKVLLEKIETKKKAILDEREAIRKAQEEAERARREEEERKRKAEEYKALLEKETAEFEIARAASIALLKEHKYQEAIESLKTTTANFQTEATNSVLLIIEHYGYLKDLKTFLIERLTNKPFRWGWGTGIAVQDILSADETGILLRTRRVPWSEVSIAQMLKIADHYIADKELKLREIGKYNVATAILCHYFELPQSKIKSYIQHAVDMYPQIKPEIKRLFPFLQE